MLIKVGLCTEQGPGNNNPIQPVMAFSPGRSLWLRSWRGRVGVRVCTSFLNIMSQVTRLHKEATLRFDVIVLKIKGGCPEYLGLDPTRD